ncbi:MAG: GNAT family N-acetyltransferase [Actinobacteria bacterium]|nr:GNAT family N-acetyltransferase [Actinomycetota bacterium]
MSVRRATTADLDALVRLGELYCIADNAEWQPDRARRGFAGLLDDDTHGVVLVTDNDGDVCGYAVLTWGWSIECGGRESLLDEMFIEHPGQGLGSELLEAVIATAAEHGAARVFLETEAGNESARDFWLKRGFELEDSVWLQRLTPTTP